MSRTISAGLTSWKARSLELPTSARSGDIFTTYRSGVTFSSKLSVEKFKPSINQGRCAILLKPIDKKENLTRAPNHTYRAGVPYPCKPSLWRFKPSILRKVRNSGKYILWANNLPFLHKPYHAKSWPNGWVRQLLTISLMERMQIWATLL